MKEIIAIFVFLSVSGVTFYFAIKGKIKVGLTLTFLVFAIASGICISNYDTILQLKLENKLGSFKVEIEKVKDTALEEIESAIAEQRESINLLITNANNTKDEIENQNKSLTKLIKTATELKNEIETQKNNIIELNSDAENTKNEIKKLNLASAQIALLLVKATYFTLKTKNEFGTDRAEVAIKEIEDGLNKILPMVIPNERERQFWVKKLKNTLPPKK